MHTVDRPDHDPGLAAAKRKRGSKWVTLAKHFGLRVKMARELRGLTQPDLAKLSDSGVDQISRLEAGGKPEVSAGLVFDVCKALKVDPCEMWWDKADASGKPQSPVETPNPKSSVNRK